MADNDWCVAVFRCKPADIRQMLTSLYGFVKKLEGVKSLHFITRDRLKGDVVFSFRVLVDSKDKRIVKSKMNCKLGTLMPAGRFAVDPDKKNPLEKYFHDLLTKVSRDTDKGNSWSSVISSAN